MAKAQSKCFVVQSDKRTDGTRCSAERDTLINYLQFEFIPASLADVKDFFKIPGTDVDERDKEGKTALMMACGRGLVDIVQFLLKRGANPNLACTEYGNTALHCASNYIKYDNLYDYDSSDDELPSRAAEKYEVQKYNKREQDRNTIKIMKLLHNEYNADILANNSGLNPIDLAGLKGKLATVEYCVNNEWVPIDKQIKALEILAMALAIDGDHINTYRTLHSAMKKRHGQPASPVEEGQSSVLESCLGHAKCRTLDDLRKIKTNKHAIIAECFLIRDSVLPDQSEDLYHNLARYGYSLILCKKTVSKAFDVFSGCLVLEKKGHLPLGCTLRNLMQGLDMGGSMGHLSKVVPQLTSHVCTILNEYVDVIRQVSPAQLEASIKEMVQNLANVFDFTLTFFSVKTMEDIFAPIAAMMAMTWSRIPKPSVKPRDNMYVFRTISVCHQVLIVMREQLSSNNLHLESDSECNRFKRLIAQLLQFEGACNVDSLGNNMLHTILDFMSTGKLQMVIDIIHLLLRHGCPRDQKNDRKQTPADVVKEEVLNADEDGVDYPEHLITKIYDLLNEPTEVNSLQELATRAILYHRISYHEILPEMICTLVKDSILQKDDSWF